MNTSPQDPERARQVGFALALLSLDLATGTHALMGLDTPDEQAFRATLRAEELGPVAGTAGVAHALDALGAQLGEPYVERLLGWIDARLFGPSDPQVFLWRVIVGQRRLLDMPQLAQRICAELAEIPHDPPPRVPTSARDVELLRAYGFPTEAVLGELSPSPLPLLENLIQDRAFVIAWDRAIARSPAPEQEIKALHAWGKDQGESFGFSKLARPGGWSAS